MGNCKTVSIEEIKQGNPRLCLSALRVFNRCHECPQYANCESKIVNVEFENLTHTKKELTDDYKKKIETINKKIKALV
jgi:hypothetical protein